MNVTMMSEDFKPGKGELKTDPVDVNNVKEKILDYIKRMALQVDKLCDSISLEQGPTEKKDGLKLIFLDSPKIYN